MAKKIILTGAQGTGKTTIMNELAKDGTKTLSVVRELAMKHGFPPQNGKEEEWQKCVFDGLLSEMTSNESYISDRGLTCVAAHTFAYALNGTIKKEIADNQYLEICKFHAENPDALLVYFPIEFDIEDDGIRNTDVENQKIIDFLIKNILDTTGIPFITVTGTVEERVKQIEEALKNLQN